MRLNRLYIENFTSFEKQEIDFTKFTDEPILVIGNNHDEPGANSNGSGKSSLLNALSWAMFGSIPSSSSMSVSDIIRQGASGCEVVAEFNNGLVITRSRSNKVNLSYSYNGKTHKFNRSGDAQAALSKIMGFHPSAAFQDYLTSCFFSVESMFAFASSSKSEEKMKVIARFLGLDILDIAKSKARDRRLGINGNVQSLTDSISRFQLSDDECQEYNDLKHLIAEKKEMINSFDVQLAELKILVPQAQEKERLSDKRKMLETQLLELDVKAEEEKIDLGDEIQGLSIQLGPVLDEYKELSIYEEQCLAMIKEGTLVLDLSNEFEEISDEISDLNKDRIKIKTEHEKVLDYINSTKKMIDNAPICPCCKSKLSIIGGKIKVHDIAMIMEEVNKKMVQSKELLDQSEQLTVKRKEIETKREKLAEKQKELKKVESKLTRKRELNVAIDTKQQHISSLKERLINVDKKAERRRKTFSDELELIVKRLMDLNLSESLENLIARERKYTQERTELIKLVEVYRSKRKAYRQRYEETLRYKKDLNDLLAKQEVFSYWENGFTTIRRWRIDDFLPKFEDEINKVLSQMEVSMRVNLDTLRKAKKADRGSDLVRERFDIQVLDGAEVQRDLSTFSSGESKRISIAISLALKQLTMMKGTNRLEMILMDEVVDSLDELGRELFFRAISSLSGMKLIISHDAGLKEHFKQVIEVVKENGISRIN